MSTRNRNKDYCPTCNHIIAKPRRGLSSLVFRNIVKNITSLEDLSNAEDRLVQIYIAVSQSNFDMTYLFVQELEHKIGVLSIDELKDWLLEQINIVGNDQGEKNLYRFLQDNYQNGLDEPFSVFYNKYRDSLQEGDACKSKNFVSRALDAIGIKARMSTILVDEGLGQRKKCAMILRVSAEELYDIFNRIRIDS